MTDQLEEGIVVQAEGEIVPEAKTRAEQEEGIIPGAEVETARGVETTIEVECKGLEVNQRRGATGQT